MKKEMPDNIISMGPWEGTTIYRYLSVERFLDIVETGKNTLAHISKWEDPNEAYLIRSKIAESSIDGDDDRVRNWYELYRTFYGQSWMFNGTESDVLWRAYGMRGDTVRIETTIRDLKEDLSRVVSKNDIPYDLTAYIGAISYVDEMCDEGSDDMAVVKTLFTKRKEFADEREFRIVIKVDDTEDRAGDNRVASSLVKNGLLSFEVSVKNLIKSVLVDPCCPRGRLDEIQCRVMNAGYDFEIRKSALFDWPSPNRTLTTTANKIERTMVSDGNVRNEPCSEIIVQRAAETRFWTMFQKAYHNGKSEFSGRMPPSRRYWGMPIRNGLCYYVTLNRECARAELYIDYPNRERNKAFFDKVHDSIQVKHSDWNYERLDDRRASRIAIVNNDFTFQKREKWNEAIHWLCEALDMVKNETAKYVEQF